MELIHHIIGRTIQTYDPSATEMTDLGPKEIKEYEIVLGAKILLNGEPVKLADLQRGDSVRIGSGRQDGFYAIEALRHPDAVRAAAAQTDLSHPKTLVLEHEHETPITSPPSPSHTPTTPVTPPVIPPNLAGKKVEEVKK
jgi:hypothetical protein